MTAPTREEVAMNPADRVREAARSAVVQFTALLEYLDHIAKGRDGSPHVDAEDRSALDALRAALAEIESLRAELAAAREKKPVAWAIFNDRMSGPVVGCDEAEIRGNATMTGDRVVPLIIPPGAGG